MDSCALTYGQCYQYCPRAFVDMDAISQSTFGSAYSADELGATREVLIAGARDTTIREKARYGGTVTALLTLAMFEGPIHGTLITRTTSAGTPQQAFLARTKKEILQAAGSNHMDCPVLEACNRLPEDSKDRLAIVGLPCRYCRHQDEKGASQIPGQHQQDKAGDRIVLYVGASPGQFQTLPWQDAQPAINFKIWHTTSASEPAGCLHFRRESLSPARKGQGVHDACLCLLP